MGTYRAVLAAVSRGRPITAVAEELDLREDAVRGMVRSMLRAGHLRELGCDGETCSTCPMADACGLAAGGPASYVVTDDGMAYLDDGESGKSQAGGDAPPSPVP
ncbi:MAG: hypothetical protein V5A23_05830 [Halobacteriales archaeon]